MTSLQELTSELHALRDEAAAAIQAADSPGQVEETRVAIFGKKGRLTSFLRGMAALPAEERPLAGKEANEVKVALQQALDDRAAALKQAEHQQSVRSESIDVSLPGTPPRVGSLHPITLIQRRIEAIFEAMGFSVELGPDIETDHFNFEALNFPADHPARDLHDTFYLGTDLLLRTHTSPVQIHVMQSRTPPMAVIAPGRCYRCDADATHSPMFHQVEGFMVDSNIRFSDLKGVLEAFIHRMFGPGTPYRFRPHYFPFTEPSAEVDILFERKRADGRVVKEWLEILGAGMIHPNVLENCNINPEIYTGFAFGMGIDRIAMLKYGISAMNHFFDNDQRFLSQFE